MSDTAEQGRVTVPKVVGHAPILLVSDVAASVDYWVEKIGFTVAGLYGEPVAFAILHRDRKHIMLADAPKDHTIVPHWKIRDKTHNIYFWVDDAMAMYAEMKERGATIDYEPGEQPYGVLEFGIQDLDGHDIAFGEDLNPSGGD